MTILQYYPLSSLVSGYGVASDHSVAVARPNLDPAYRTGFSRTEVRSRRVVLASSVALLGMFLACFDWQLLHSLQGVDSKLEYMNAVVFSAQDQFCPVEQFTVRLNQKFIVSAKLSKLSRLKSVEFRRNRYSLKFKSLQKEFMEVIRAIKNVELMQL